MRVLLAIIAILLLLVRWDTLRTEEILKAANLKKIGDSCWIGDVGWDADPDGNCSLDDMGSKRK